MRGFEPFGEVDVFRVEPDDEPCLAIDKVRYKGEQVFRKEGKKK